MLDILLETNNGLVLIQFETTGEGKQQRKSSKVATILHYAKEAISRDYNSLVSEVAVFPIVIKTGSTGGQNKVLTLF